MEQKLGEILVKCQSHAEYLTQFMSTHSGIKDSFLHRVKDSVWHFMANENMQISALCSILEFEIKQHTPDSMSWQQSHSHLQSAKEWA